jgi:hypothetical protein
VLSDGHDATQNAETSANPEVEVEMAPDPRVD